MNNISVTIDKDTDGFSGVYIYDEVINKYVKSDNSYPYPFIMGYSIDGGVNFKYQGSQYYWAIPCNNYELLLNKTTLFSKSGGFAEVTIIEIKKNKRSTKAGKKIKW